MAQLAQVEQSTELSISEQQRLVELEGVVERGLKTFVEVGNALMEIRDARLYRETFGTFEDYCQKRWGMQRAHAYRLIDASAVVANLSPIGDIPANEAQARPLVSLDPDAQRVAWQLAVETAPNGKVTGAHVERTVAMMNTTNTGRNGSQKDPSYTPIWELERNIRTWLDENYRPEQWQMMLGKVRERPFSEGYSPTFQRYLKNAYRKHEVIQAANNVLEQLRQQERRVVDVPASPVGVSQDISNQGSATIAAVPPSAFARPGGRGGNILHSSESSEYYTPADYVEAVRATLGVIDLDPASCELANRTVRAQTFYTVDEDGLQQEWIGRVFLNPPYGKDGNESNQAKWSHRLIEEYQAGNVEEAVLLVNATPGNKWWAPLWQFPICFVDHRIHFYTADGATNQATHSNAFVYLGCRPERLIRFFKRFGPIVTEVVTDDRST